MFEQETIAAIATSSKNGSISVIRVSGENSFSIVSRIFCNEKGTLIDLNEKKSHTIQYGFIFDGSKKIDEVLVLLMKAPKSYTAEDVVEIQCHGGHYICQVILDLLVRHGVRVAEPGEFTKRAFLNGRLDLSQAEAVMDVIQSKSELALSNSMSQLRGSIKNRIQKLREVILEDVAYLEAALDDPEHISLDSFDETIEGHVRALLKDTNHLLENCNNGRIMKEGIQTVIVGKPNVGKSTLMNRLIGQKIAITSNKPQTTRNRIQTVYTDMERGQIVFLDTPGIHKAKNKLGEYMVNVAEKTLNEVDVVLWLVEPSNFIGAGEQHIVEQLKKVQTPVILVINKVDTVEKDKVLEFIDTYRKIYDFAEIIPTSALRGQNVDDVIDSIFKYLPYGPQFYDEDTITDQPERAICAEIIREKALHALSDEVPHGIAVAIDQMKPRKGGKMYDIDATIVCERDSHKGIIIGKQGSMLKKIGTNARYEMEKMLDAKVNLKLWVKVKKDWRDSDFLIKNFGYREEE